LEGKKEREHQTASFQAEARDSFVICRVPRQLLSKSKIRHPLFRHLRHLRYLESSRVEGKERERTPNCGGRQ